MGRLIDADEAIEKQWYGNSNPILYRQYTVQVLKNCPTVDAATVVRGKWIFHDNGDATCDQCGRYQKAIWDYDNWQNFCGNCGADMREVQNERD